MVSEASLSGDRHVPVRQIVEETLRIADSAECKEGSWAVLAHIMAAFVSREAAETQQSRLRIENRKLVREHGFDVSPLHLPSYNDKVGSRTRADGFPQISGGQQRLLDAARTIQKKYVHIARQL